MMRDQPNKLEVAVSTCSYLIISPGGVGTTFLLEWCRKFTDVNCPYDTDGLKHLSTPKGVERPIIFIYGDPVEITDSISRRGWLKHQARKISCCGAGKLPDTMLRILFPLLVNRQIAHYRKAANHNRNILILSYDDIWRRKGLIAEHLNIADNTFLSSFPRKRKRSARL